jgi:4-diphosphocytidyl-2-C-methyl-D-erythritol kinase
LPRDALHELAARLGADVPFFLEEGPQLGMDDGTTLSPLDLPQDFWVLLVLPRRAVKPSTASVYAAFDERGGADGWEARRDALLEGIARVRRPRDLAALPPNDLARSSLADELLALGAFRADVSGAGPTVYGLFHHRAAAEAAKRALKRPDGTWITPPAWYG